MAHTTGLVRGGLVINKIFVNSNKSQQDVKEDTSCDTIDVKKQ